MAYKNKMRPISSIQNFTLVKCVRRVDASQHICGTKHNWATLTWSGWDVFWFLQRLRLVQLSPLCWRQPNVQSLDVTIHVFRSCLLSETPKNSTLCQLRIHLHFPLVFSELNMSKMWFVSSPFPRLQCLALPMPGRAVLSRNMEDFCGFQSFSSRFWFA